METEKETELWYAMRATYRREPDAVRLLGKENMDCFVPMQYKVTVKKGKKVRILVPVIHNLIFVHACPSALKRVKSKVTIYNISPIPAVVRKSSSRIMRCVVS